MSKFQEVLDREEATVFLKAENPRLIPGGHREGTGRNFLPHDKENNPVIKLLSLGF